LFDTLWFLKALMWATPLGFIAVVAGWTTTETGRQPWTVYGVLRTADSVTPSLTGFDVLLSLLGYMAVYLIMFPTGLWFVLRIVRGGVAAEEEAMPVEGGRPAAPVKPVPGAAP
jgi:cytochrome d ubiquinol oxidase subunit I